MSEEVHPYELPHERAAREAEADGDSFPDERELARVIHEAESVAYARGYALAQRRYQEWTLNRCERAVEALDVLPAAAESMRWPEPPPMNDKWQRAVCAAAERTRAAAVDLIRRMRA